MDSSVFRDLAETSVDGLWAMDLDACTKYANPAVAALFGVSREEFESFTGFDVLDEDGKVQFADHLEELRAGRPNTAPVEVYFVRRDGTGLWTLVTEQLLRDAQGEISGFLHRFSEYHERRQRLDELTRSRRQLAEGYAIARLGSFTLDVDTDLVVASQGIGTDDGPDASEPVTVSAWLDAVHHDDRERLRGALGAALRDGGDLDVLVRVTGPEGWIWTHCRGVVQRDAAGRITGLSGTNQDVTGHKRIELALERQMARNALTQAVATACNEARTLGEALGELRCVISGREDWLQVRAYLHDKESPEADQLLSEIYEEDAEGARPDHALACTTLHTGETAWDASGTVLAFPLHFRGRVHAVITLTARATPDDPVEALAAVREAASLLTRVIEREDAERLLAEARDAAIRASQAKSDFLAMMSHEIRTPLNGVIGLNDLMLKTSLQRRQRQLGRGIRDAGRSLLRLVNDVLDLSKIEAGHLEMETVDFDVREVCDQAVALMGDAARRNGVELAVACGPDVPEILAGDPTRLGQVLTNLVSNAVKFTEDGHVRVQVGSQWAGRRVRLLVEVTDTGEGIAADALEHVFDDFSQADISTTRRHGGTGLGLSISRRIVEAFGGELSVVSTLGEGSTFFFSAVLDLPRGLRTSPDDDMARSRLSGARVLVVSDGESCVDLLSDQLALWHTRVDRAAGSDEAALAVQHADEEEDPYEAVLVDVPAVRAQDADHAAELLALAGGRRSFIVLTPRPDTAVVWGVREPAVQVLTKPVTSAALRDALLGVDEDEAPLSATTVTLMRADQPRVLVVEDNPVNQMVARGMLESLGYEVELAEDGVEAVDRFDPERHAAVLMDVQMPRMDGYAATRALRERHGPSTPILAMTAVAIDGERRRCRDAGMDDFLTKPVEMNQLGAALARWTPPRPAALAESLTGPAATSLAPARVPAELQISADFHVTPVQPGSDEPVEEPTDTPVGCPSRRWRWSRSPSRWWRWSRSPTRRSPRQRTTCAACSTPPGWTRSSRWVRRRRAISLAPSTASSAAPPS